MSDERREQEERARKAQEVRERETDALMQMVGKAAIDRLDPSDPRDAAFFDWFVDEARARRSAEERRQDQELAREFGRRMAIRWAQRSLGIHDIHAAPPVRASGVHTTVAAALDRLHAAPGAPHLDMAVAAGAGRELWDEECSEFVELPPDVPPGRHLALRVTGDSMTPYLHAADTVLVRLGEGPKAGSVVVAKLEDGGYVMKRVGSVDRYKIELLSLNPAYVPLSVVRDERTVLGTVVLRWCPHSVASV